MALGRARAPVSATRATRENCATSAMPSTSSPTATAAMFTAEVGALPRHNVYVNWNQCCSSVNYHSCMLFKVLQSNFCLTEHVCMFINVK